MAGKGVSKSSRWKYGLLPTLKAQSLRSAGITAQYSRILGVDGIEGRISVQLRLLGHDAPENEVLTVGVESDYGSAVPKLFWFE
jgi:hypothetical protein